MTQADSAAPEFTLLELGYAIPQGPRDTKPSHEGRRKVILEADYYLQAQALIEALHELNEPPTIFQRSGSLVQVVSAANDVSIKPFDPDTFVTFAQERLRCVRVSYPPSGGRIELVANISRNAAKHVLNASNWPFPVLRGLARSPHFSADGKLVKTSGYSPQSKLYVELDGFTLPQVKKIPIEGTDVARAKEVILGDLLGDFPFADQASRANAVALILLPFARELIDGPTPLHAVDASTEGTGKSLLTKVQAFVMNGSKLKTMSEGQDDSELRKRITSILLNSPDIVIFDNVSKTLDSGALAAVLTTTKWEDRLLGSSQTVTVPNTAVWVVTGNNITVSREIARRLVWIRLDAKMERPWQRTAFKHPNLMSWLKENRAAVVHACLILIQFWISCGKPPGKVTLGSFESWSEIIGGILENAVIPGFLANADHLQAHADAESVEWRAFVEVWAERHQNRAVGTAELLNLAKEHDLLMDVIGSGNLRSQSIRLGKALRKHVERVFNGRTIKQGDPDAARNVSRFYLSVMD